MSTSQSRRRRNVLISHQAGIWTSSFPDHNKALTPCMMLQTTSHATSKMTATLRECRNTGDNSRSRPIHRKDTTGSSGRIFKIFGRQSELSGACLGIAEAAGGARRKGVSGSRRAKVWVGYNGVSSEETKLNLDDSIITEFAYECGCPEAPSRREENKDGRSEHKTVGRHVRLEPVLPCLLVQFTECMTRTMITCIASRDEDISQDPKGGAGLGGQERKSLCSGRIWQVP